MATPPYTKKDYTQVIKEVYDEENRKLMVDAAISGDIIINDIDISQENDSIRIGDGTDLITATNSDGKTGLDVNIINDIELNIDQDSDSISIGDGVNELVVNSDGSINAVIQDEPGEEVVNFNMASSIAGGATSDHDLVVSAGGKLFQVHSSGSGKMKVEVQIETGAATDIFNTVLVGFNSSSAPNIDLQLAKYAVIPAGARVKVIRTNRDLQAQDLYSTIVILED